MITKRRAIVWFRQDLRLHDNVALTEAINSALEVIPVFVFDDRLFQEATITGFPRTGPHRLRFILESVSELRKRLHGLGGKLIVRMGRTEDILFSIAEQAKSSWIFCNRERTPIEVEIQDVLEKMLWGIGQEMRYSRGKMLYHTADLPFPIQHVPDSFAQYRKETERYVSVRSPLPEPTKNLAQLTVDIEEGEIPTMLDFGYSDLEANTDEFRFMGGERAALNRLQYFLWESGAFPKYPKTAQGIQGDDMSSMISPWLAQGCLSPKWLYQELKAYEQKTGNVKCVKAFIQALLLRDFHRFMAKKHGEVIFDVTGISGNQEMKGKWDTDVFLKWVNGETGVPFIDAAMMQLKRTGFLPNRLRQNVASYLINDLGISWVLGASYFEHILIDYDVTSNWSNWNQMAGVGSELRDDRCLSVNAQAQRYDPQGSFTQKWLHRKKEKNLQSVPDQASATPLSNSGKPRRASAKSSHTNDQTLSSS